LTPEPGSFLAVNVAAASLASAIAIGVGLVVYFKKGKVKHYVGKSWGWN